MATNRMDWTIKQTSAWVATYKDGTVLIARTRAALMTKINEFEAA